MSLNYEMIASNNDNKLDEAKIHTQYKIIYIKDYVRRWLNVAVNYIQKNIVFIDGMCNAGIYKGGIKGTCMEVIESFIEYAEANRDKNFYVFLNDNNLDRIKILNELINGYSMPSNLKVYIENMDVVEYLNSLIYDNKFNDSCFTLLYIDPYNFGIKKLLSTIKDFVNKYYCELLFNYFSSDVTRNRNNTYAYSKMSTIANELSSVINDLNIESDANSDILKKLITTYKNTKNIRYSFAYRFNNSNNAELYYIIFFTPSKRGLELIKESIWSVFNGEDSFKRQIDDDKKQLRLFDTGNMLIDMYSVEMRKAVTKLMIEKRQLPYEEIETYVLENSLLKESQIIKPILIPLINNNVMKKIEPIGAKKSNYKKCMYKICEKI